MCHVHSHPPSHHTGKILDGQSLISGKRVLVVHNTHRQQKNLQARNPCSVQETISSQNSKAVSTWVFVASCPDPVWCHRLSLQPFNSKRMRTPPLAWAPWLQISDTVCLSADIGPVLLFVKMCVWLYQIPPPRKSINFQACLQGHTHHKNDLCEHLFFEITSTRQPHRRPNFRPNQRCNK